MNYLIRLCSIAATFFTFEYCLKLIVCPNKKRYFTTSITIFSKHLSQLSEGQDEHNGSDGNYPVLHVFPSIRSLLKQLM